MGPTPPEAVRKFAVRFVWLGHAPNWDASDRSVVTVHAASPAAAAHAAESGDGGLYHWHVLQVFRWDTAAQEWCESPCHAEFRGNPEGDRRYPARRSVQDTSASI